MWKSKLSDGEIYQIEILCREGISVPEIAKRLGRHKSSLYEFFQVNGIVYNRKKEAGKPGRLWKKSGTKCKIRFSAQAVINKRKKRKSAASIRYCRIEPWGKLEAYIAQKLRDYWSPDEIAGSWRVETGEPLSKDTIYQHLYDHWEREEIKKYLRRKCKRYRNRKKEAIHKKYCIQDRVMIDQRPDIINKRERIGDWEADTIVGKTHKQLIATFVERRTGYTCIRRLRRPTAISMLSETKNIFKDIPGKLRRSITYDNGKENALHYQLRNQMSIQTYFCFPYHSWEKWSIENLNMLLRQFIPKRTDFDTISDEQLQHYEYLLNSRPRKRLNYLTPHEVFWGEKKSRDSD